MIIEYRDIPSTLAPIIKERIEACKNFFPSWVTRLNVHYDTPLGKEYELACESEYAYRFVVITVGEEFFRTENWREALLHEIIHATVAPFTTQTWVAMDSFSLDDTTRKYMEIQLRQAEEAMACDVSALLDKVLEEKA